MDVWIESPLPPEECRHRIEASLEGRLGATVPRTWRETVVGRVDADEVRVTIAGVRDTALGPMMSTDAPVFVGRVIATPTGSALVGSVGVRDAMRAFLALYWGGVALFFMVFLVVAIAKAGSDPSILFLPVFMVLFAAFSGLLFRVFRWNEKQDAVKMIERLARAVEGRIAATPPGQTAPSPSPRQRDSKS